MRLENVTDISKFDLKKKEDTVPIKCYGPIYVGIYFSVLLQYQSA